MEEPRESISDVNWSNTGGTSMEEAFWNSLPLFLPQEAEQLPISDYRFAFITPDEDVWIPSDQTIHWGKRPHSIYPYIQLLKKEDLPSIPRGSRLVAKLLYADWQWDDLETAKESDVEPATCRCLEDDKIMVPFEKGAAVFRHLRVSKNIKLKGLESFSIKTLGVEIGYHNPYSETPFKSLDILLTKEVRIHIVAHKGSVGFMRKHGLAKVQNAVESEPKTPPNVFPPPVVKEKPEKPEKYEKAERKERPATNLASSSSSTPINLADQLEGSALVPFSPPPLTTETKEPQLPRLQPPSLQLPSTPQPSPIAVQLPPIQLSAIAAQLIANQQQQLSNTLASTAMSISTNLQESTSDQLAIRSAAMHDLKRTAETTASELSALKKQKTTQLTEILDELAGIQARTEYLKKKISEFLNTPIISLDKTIQITAPAQYSPSNFIFYAFRIRDLDLGVSLSKSYNFDIANSRDPKGYTLLHTAAKSSFYEGVKWCLEHGAPVNARSNHRSTALHFAYQRNNKNIIDLLKQYNADENVVNVYGLKPKDYHNQRKPLPHKNEGVGCVEVVVPGFERPFKLSVWFAARIGWLEVVTLYIGHLGFDVDMKTPAGVTPLMCACEYNRYEVVEYLLQMGADPNARDIYDKTPLHYAYVNYNQDIIRLLEENGADSTLNNVWNHPPCWYKDKKVVS